MTTPVYTVEEVATQLRVRPLTIYRAIKAGRLEALRIGRRYRITPEARDTFTKAPRRNKQPQD